MPCSYPVPKDRSVEAILGGVIDGGVKVKRDDTVDPERDTPGAFAEYVTDEDALVLLCFADHTLVNRAGGALVSLQPEVVEEQNKKFVVYDGALEGFREIANVFAAALNSEDTPHIRLRSVTVVPGPLSDEVKDLSRQPQARRSFRVLVEEYGAGSLIVYAR